MAKNVRADLEALKRRLIEEARAEEEAVDVDEQVDEVKERFTEPDGSVTVYGKAHADFSVIATDDEEENN